MAYGVKYTSTHKTTTNGTEVTHTIEILQKDYVGSSTEVNGDPDQGFFNLHYENVDINNFFQNPVIKGRLEFHLHVSPDFAYDGETILDEIDAADEQEYQMRYKRDGSVFWTGYVLPDMGSVPENDYVYSGMITAKDLTRLAEFDFPLSTTRNKLITTLADFLDDLDLGLDIYTYTSFITSETTDASDYLNQIYAEEAIYRDFARNADETASPWNNMKCLTEFCRNHGLIIIQVNNAWRLYQITALSDPTSVTQFRYNSSGVLQATSTVDLTTTIDSSTKYLIKPTNKEKMPAVHSVATKFDHRLKDSESVIPNPIELDSVTTSEVITQQNKATGSQFFTISASPIIGEFSTDTGNSAYIKMVVKAGSYYWNHGTLEWQSSYIENQFSIGSTYDSLRSIEPFSTGILIETGKSPADAIGDVEITVFNAQYGSGGGGDADSTTWKNLTIDTENPETIENSEYINYKLTQSGKYSFNYEHPDIYTADGPVSYAVSAMRFSASDDDITGDIWQRRGTTTGYRSFTENLLKELLDPRRTRRRLYNAVVLGAYLPDDILSYDSAYFLYLGGGSINGANELTGYFFELNIETGSDTLETFPKYQINPSSSASSGGTGIDASTADGRYLQIANNGSDIDDPAVFRTNIDVYSTGESDAITDVIAADVTELQSDVVENYLDIDALWDDKVSRGQFLQLVAGDGVAIDDETQRLLSADLIWNLSINYNATNLQITAGQINTIQDIDTAATPQFAGMTLSDVLNFIGGYDIQVDGSNVIEFDEVGEVVSVLWDFEVLGEVLSANVTNMDVDDPLIKLADGNATSILDIGWIGQRSGNNIGAIWDESEDEFAFIFTSDDGTTTGNVTISSYADIKANDAYLANAIFSEDIVTDDYSLTTDFSGTGWTGTGDGDFNIKTLTVRDYARFRELIIDQLSVVAGSDLRSVARGKVKSVNAGANQITLENPNNISATSFVANDFFWFKSADIDGGTFLDLKGQVTAVSVTTVSGEEVITLTLDTSVTGGTHDGGSTDISGLSVGDVIVQRGHPTNTDRQALIYTTVADSDAPVQKYFTGIDSLAAFDAVANISTQIGNLESLTSTYANVSGEGFYSSNAFLTDNLIVGDLDLVSNFLRYNSGELTANLKSLLLEVGGTAEDLDTAVQELRSDLIELYLQSDGAYSGIQFLSGQVILTAGGSNSIAQIRLDGTGTSSVINLAADYVITTGTALFFASDDDTDPAGDLAAATFINGAKIITESITATQIDVDDLFAQTVTITGAFNLGTGGSFNSDVIDFDETTFLLDAGKIVMDSVDLALIFYEDSLQTTPRYTVDIDGTTLKSTPTVRDSASGTNATNPTAIDIVDYERIFGTFQVEETAGDIFTNYDYKVRYQGWNGSTWITLGSYDGSTTGQSVDNPGPIPFVLQDVSGYTQFRLIVEDRNSSGGTWQFDSYEYDQTVSEVIYNERGFNIVGGNLYLTEFPNSDGSAPFELGNLPSWAVFSDEKDSNGNWIVKVKA